MVLRIIAFLSTFILLLGGAVTYLGRRSISLCPALSQHRAWVWGTLWGFLFLMIVTLAANRLSGHRIDALSWASFSLFGFVSTGLVYFAVADAAYSLARRAAHLPAWTGAYVCYGVLALSLLSCAIGLWTVLRPVGVMTVEVPVKDLPEGLEGFRIVQISDLHLGATARAAQVRRIVEQTNAFEPDLVAVTGDLVDGEADGARTKAIMLGAIRSQHGVFFVTGNHEYYSGVGPWLDVIRSLGWKDLRNAHETIEHQGAELAVVGLPDPAGSRSIYGDGGPNLPKALSGVSNAAFKLLLFHRPTGYEEAEKSGVGLQLSGHTHGGQYFPWNIVVKSFFMFPKGLNRYGNMWIYTSSGTGFWGPPDRFLVPPELTRLVLRRKS